MSEHNGDRWLDQPRNINKLIYGLYAMCGLLIVVEFFLHKHAHFSIEEIPGFYGLLGFVAFIAVVRGGEALRKIVKREVDYYDE